MGDVLDSEVSPYYKKLEIGDIFYNPYTWDVARVLSWKNSKIKFNVYAAYRFVNHERRIHHFSTSEQPRLEEYPIRDFIIYSKIIRDSRHIFLQVSPCTRKYSHPFSLDTYIQKKKPCFDKERWTDKEDMLNREKISKRKKGAPYCLGAQQY